MFDRVICEYEWLTEKVLKRFVGHWLHCNDQVLEGYFRDTGFHQNAVRDLRKSKMSCLYSLKFGRAGVWNILNQIENGATSRKLPWVEWDMDIFLTIKKLKSCYCYFVNLYGVVIQKHQHFWVSQSKMLVWRSCKVSHWSFSTETNSDTLVCFVFLDMNYVSVN